MLYFYNYFINNGIEKKYYLIKDKLRKVIFNFYILFYTITDKAYILKNYDFYQCN